MIKSLNKSKRPKKSLPRLPKNLSRLPSLNNQRRRKNRKTMDG